MEPSTWDREMAQSTSSEENCSKFKECTKKLQVTLSKAMKERTETRAGQVVGCKKLDEDTESSYLSSGLACIMQLKKYNRLEKMLLKKNRDKVSEARQMVDSQHLQYVNMMYELQHLRTEIAKCLDYKSAVDEIEMVPEQQFYDQAPPSISCPEVTKSDPHELCKARLEWELTQRKSLKEERKVVESEKKTVLAHIKKRKSRLDSLLPKLKEAIEATKPVQEALGVQKEKSLYQEQFLQVFPVPMFLLYCRFKAYKDAYNPNLVLDILGDLEKVEKQMREVKSVPDLNAEIEEQSELESQELSDVRSERSKKRQTKSDPANVQPMRISTKLDSSIQISFEVKEGDLNGQVKLIFYYFPKLNIVSVHTSFMNASEGPSPASGIDLLRPSSLLSFLRNGDDKGDEFPTLESQLLAKSNKIKFVEVFGEDRPFKWAQILAGIDLAAENVKADKSLILKADLVSTDVQSLFKDIKSRIGNRLILEKTLNEIDSGHLVLPQEYADKLLTRVVANMSKISAVDLESFYTEFSSRTIVEAIHLKAGFVVKFTVKSDKVGVTSHVVIPLDYPCSNTIFILNWISGSEVTNKDMLMNIEQEVNVEIFNDIKIDPAHNMTVQIHHLKQCVDIVAAHNALQKGTTVEASGTKIFKPEFNSRTRVLPFKYDPESRTFDVRY
ncbi:THO complex subunit 5 homolog isoform X1 [Artemia franciscana]|uniref:THO complex subunit 5 homolog isoform X1 n=1 Tax=Artemia franciscana TaxID=6661 RepID=UPI0032DA59D7